MLISDRYTTILYDTGLFVLLWPQSLHLPINMVPRHPASTSLPSQRHDPRCFVPTRGADADTCDDAETDARVHAGPNASGTDGWSPIAVSTRHGTASTDGSAISAPTTATPTAGPATSPITSHEAAPAADRTATSISLVPREKSRTVSSRLPLLTTAYHLPPLRSSRSNVPCDVPKLAIPVSPSSSRS